MKEQVVLLIDNAQQGADLLEHISRQGQSSDFHVYLSPEGEEGIACLKDLISVSLEPSVIVVGPHAGRPLESARQLHSIAPAAYLIFIADEDGIDVLRQEIRSAPAIGNYALLSARDLRQLDRLLRENIRAARQKAHLRSAIDPELSSTLLNGSRAYRKPVTPDRYVCDIIAHARDAVFSIDDSGVITTWNAGAERIFGFGENEALGQSLDSLLAEDQRSALNDWIQAVHSGEPPAPSAVRCLRADGSEVDVELALAPITDGSGRCVGTSAIGRDIGHRKRAERSQSEVAAQEHAARIEAENASRLKDKFLATLSHELRTPLNSILGWVHILRTGQSDPGTTARALEMIESNTKLQARLIRDLIEVSELTSGKVHLQREAVQLPPIISQTVESIRCAAESKSIGLEIQVDGFVEPVWGDRERLCQMIDNLLSNAVRFTSAGGKIQIALTQSGDEVRIRITDAGIAIKPEFLPHLFHYFRQADSSINRAFGSLGVGLEVVGRLAELHGGAVTAESLAAETAVFVIRLPLLAGADPSAAPKSSPARKDLSGVSVLLADDEAETRAVLATLLQQAGATVTAAADSVEVCDSIRRSIPDVVILDIAMPYDDGYALLEKIRSHPGCVEVPAVALTGYSGEEDRKKAMAAGFRVHLAKPVDPAELIRTISALIRTPKADLV